MDEFDITTEELSIPGLIDFSNYLDLAYNAAERREVFLMRVYLDSALEIAEKYSLVLESTKFIEEIEIFGYQEKIPDYLDQLEEKAEQRDKDGFNLIEAYLFRALNRLEEMDFLPNQLEAWEERIKLAQQKVSTNVVNGQTSYLSLTPLESAASDPIAYLREKYVNYCKEACLNSNEEKGRPLMTVNLAFARRARRILDEQFNVQVGSCFEELCDRLMANHQRKFS